MTNKAQTYKQQADVLAERVRAVVEAWVAEQSARGTAVAYDADPFDGDPYTAGLYDGAVTLGEPGDQYLLVQVTWADEDEGGGRERP